jgi:uncharacterized protein (TIGR00730 family)
MEKMEKNSEAFITLPGGFGSLYETLEILVLKQLGLHQKPLTIINTNEFYTPMIAQFKDIIDKGFAPKGNSQLFYVASSPEEALTYIEKYSPVKLSFKHLRT